MIEAINENNAKEIALPIFESIHSAYATSNFQKLIGNNLSSKMKKSLTEKVFEKAINKYYAQYGNLIEMKYLGYVDRNAGHQVLWKCRYDKNSEEVIWHLFFSKENLEQYEVVGLWFGY